LMIYLGVSVLLNGMCHHISLNSREQIFPLLRLSDYREAQTQPCMNVNSSPMMCGTLHSSHSELVARDAPRPCWDMGQQAQRPPNVPAGVNAKPNLNACNALGTTHCYVMLWFMTMKLYSCAHEIKRTMVTHETQRFLDRFSALRG
jgi:hypothetical protein